MTTRGELAWLSGFAVIASPCGLAFVLGAGSLVGARLSESTIARLVKWSTLAGLGATLLVLAIMLGTGERRVVVDLGDWVTISRDYHFALKFVFDRLSVPFALLAYTLAGAIAAFARRYLHREPGFNRFFTLYALFLLGMTTTSLAGTIETLFAGWELVGLSSALLVGFSHERAAPARSALWVWCVYRVSDAALVLAAAALHHSAGGGDFDELLGSGLWPHARALPPLDQAHAVGALLLIAAAGKSALIPFSGWLPRAMEGPTPSSAVFYGALSVHLGVFLLLRVSPILDASPALCAATVALGLATALFAHLARGVQTDVKSALSFASLTQVGLITAEVGLGCRYVALVHLLAHAALRAMQFLRAPSMLREAAPRPVATDLARLARSRSSLYRFLMERGYLDLFLLELFVRPFLAAARGCDALERRWTSWLAGAVATSDAAAASIEEFT